MRLLNVQQVAEMLNVKAKTLYQWVELRQIPHRKLGRCVRFELEEIKQWVEERKSGGKGRYNIGTQTRSPRKGVISSYGAISER